MKIFVIKDKYSDTGNRFHFKDKEGFLWYLKKDPDYIVQLDLGYIEDEDSELIIHKLDIETLRVIL